MFSQLATITVIVLVLDAVWLTASSSDTRQIFAAIQGKPLQIRWLPAAAVYIKMILAVWFFAVLPSTSWYEAAGRGAILGFAMYGMYDMTNYATLSEYPLHFALTDIAWGTVLFATAAGTAKIF